MKRVTMIVEDSRVATIMKAVADIAQDIEIVTVTGSSLHSKVTLAPSAEKVDLEELASRAIPLSAPSEPQVLSERPALKSEPVAETKPGPQVAETFSEIEKSVQRQLGAHVELVPVEEVTTIITHQETHETHETHKRAYKPGRRLAEKPMAEMTVEEKSELFRRAAYLSHRSRKNLTVKDLVVRFLREQGGQAHAGAICSYVKRYGYSENAPYNVFIKMMKDKELVKPEPGVYSLVA